jgi:hypothetical protein
MKPPWSAYGGRNGVKPSQRGTATKFRKRALRGRILCVSTVSNVCAIKAPVPVQTEDGFRPAPCPLSLRLTVLTVSCNWFSPMAVILIVRVPNRPSRLKASRLLE